mgnify:CR=1 FL=1
MCPTPIPPHQHPAHTPPTSILYLSRTYPIPIHTPSAPSPYPSHSPFRSWPRLFLNAVVLLRLPDLLLWLVGLVHRSVRVCIVALGVSGSGMYHSPGSLSTRCCKLLRHLGSMQAVDYTDVMTYYYAIASITNEEIRTVVFHVLL